MSLDLDAWNRKKDEQEAAASAAKPATPAAPPPADEGDFDLEAWELDRAKGIRKLYPDAYKKSKAAAPAAPAGTPPDPASFAPDGVRKAAEAMGGSMPDPIQDIQQGQRRALEAMGGVNALTATREDISRGVESARAGIGATIGTEAEKMRQSAEQIKTEYPHYAALLDDNNEAGAWAEAERRAQAEVDRIMPNAAPEARAYTLRLQRQIEASRINTYQAATRRAGAATIARDAGIATAGEFAGKAAAIPKTREREEFDAAPDLTGKLVALAKNPAEVIRSLVAESTAQSIPAVAASAAGALMGGAGGAAAGAAIGGAGVDYTSTILGELTAAGIDLTKPEEAAAKLEANPALLDQVRATAAKRQVPMAVINAFTGALGGRFVGRAVEQGATGRAMAGAIGKELAVGAVGEAAGEAGAQLAAGQQLDLGEILAEGLGGLGGQVGEVAGTLARQNAQAADAAAVPAAPGVTSSTTTDPNAPVAGVPRVVPVANRPVADRVATPAAPLAGMDLESGLTTPPGESAPVDMGAKPAAANPEGAAAPSGPIDRAALAGLSAGDLVKRLRELGVQTPRADAVEASMKPAKTNAAKEQALARWEKAAMEDLDAHEKAAPSTASTPAADDIKARIVESYQATDIMNEKARAKFADMVYEAITAGKFNDALRPENKQSRRIFSEMTGIKLPAGLKATQGLFTGKPFSVVPPGTKPKAAEPAAAARGKVKFRRALGAENNKGYKPEDIEIVGDLLDAPEHPDYQFVVAKVPGEEGAFGIYEVSTGAGMGKYPSKAQAEKAARGKFESISPETMKRNVEAARELLKQGSATPAKPTRQVVVDKAPPGGWTDADKVPDDLRKVPEGLVKITIPGPKGPMQVAGTVMEALPDGQVRVRTQNHGLHVVPRSALVTKEQNQPLPTAAPAANLKPENPNAPDAPKSTAVPPPAGQQVVDGAGTPQGGRPGSPAGASGDGRGSPVGSSGGQGGRGKPAGAATPAAGDAPAGDRRGDSPDAGRPGGSGQGSGTPDAPGAGAGGGIRQGEGKGAGRPSVLTVLSAEKQARAEELKSRLRQKVLGEMRSGIDPAILADGIELTVLYVEAGARKFADYARQMVDAMGEEIKPYLKSFYLGARSWPDMPLNLKGEMDKGDAVDEMDLDAVLRSTEAPKEAPKDAPKADTPAPTPAPDAKPAKSKGGGGKKGSGKAPAPAPTPEPPAAPDAPPAPQGQNHRIAPDDEIVVRGEVAKTRANIAALKTLKAIEAEGRPATPEEQKIMARWVGWGGVPQVFDRLKAQARARYPEWASQWGGLYDQVESLLTRDEWEAARISTINAHYTSREIIGAMWKLAERLGFKGGKVAEFGAGIGHFAGIQPDTTAAASKWTMVEMDAMTSRLLAKLYPQADVRAAGLENVNVKNHSFALNIGNYPFAAQGPRDSRYPAFSLHNYFFARGIDAVQPGGLIVAISSMSTMDAAASREARKWMAERADLVGAIRLPNDAFKANANTEVTTDIVILRKKDGFPFKGQPWLDTVTVKGKGGVDVKVNEYFARNPGMMLGEMSLEGTMYRGNEPALVSTPGALAAKLEAAIARLPENVAGSSAFIDAENAAAPANDDGEKPGSFVVRNGKLYQVDDTRQLVVPVEIPPTDKTLNERAVSYVGVRDSLRKVLATMRDPAADDAAVQRAQAELNRLYDAHVKKHGEFSNTRRHGFLEDDSELPAVMALEREIQVEREVIGKDGRPKVVVETRYEKMPIFTQRTLRPYLVPTEAASVEDALAMSLVHRGRLSLPDMAKWLKSDEEAVRRELVAKRLAYQNPQTGLLEEFGMYLSGNVRKKLNEARNAAAQDEAYRANVEDLEKVQPPPVPFADIKPSLGMHWLPRAAIQEFANQLFGVADVSAQYQEALGKWYMSSRGAVYSAASKQQWGLVSAVGESIVGGWEIFENLMNGKPTVVYDEVNEGGKIKQVKNPTLTTLAQSKATEMQEEFVRWLSDKTQHHAVIESTYNELFNSHVLRKWQGGDFKWFPNMAENPGIIPRQAQKDVVARILQESVLLAHAVGTGKTLIQTAAAMEMRRLGLANKAMIVVQNATLLQFAKNARQFYPGAKILVPSKNQRSKAARNKTMNLIATGDWDIVIVPQSYFNMLPDKPEREAAFIQKQIDEYEAIAGELAQAEGRNSPKVKDIAKAVQKLTERMEKLMDRKKDTSIFFEDTGIDALFIDEAHAYKKVPFVTRKDNIKGLDKGSSQRAMSALQKVRWVQEQRDGRNVVLATGTPVTNTIAEAWNMIRLVRPDILKEFGVEHFDQWADTFGTTVTGPEITAGGGYKIATRFVKFKNVPELRTMFRQAADVVNQTDAKVEGLPRIMNGQPTIITIPKTPKLTKFIKWIAQQLKDFDEMSGREKKANSHIPLVMFGLGRKATLDLRLINPALGDEPGSKSNVAVGKIFDWWQKSGPEGGTQMVFADNYQYQRDGKVGFHLFKDMKAKLVAKGVPEAEIGIVTDASTDDQRQRLFEKFKKGEIRILFGTSEKMGVGVDVPQRIVALHHLDAPHRPADVEQRNGRGIRKGNQNKEVDIVFYGVEATLDAAQYNRLLLKDRAIQSVVGSKFDGREFEEEDTDSMDYSQQLALYSGDPLQMEQLALDGEVSSLRSQSKQFDVRLSTARTEAVRLENEVLPALRRVRERAGPFVDRVEAAFGKGKDIAGEVNGRAYTDRKDLVAALDKVIAEQKALASDRVASGVATMAASPGVVVRVNGFDIDLKGTAQGVNVNGRVELQPDTVAAAYMFKETDAGISLAGNANTGNGLLIALGSVGDRATAALRDMDARIENVVRDIGTHQSLLKTPVWGRAPELAQKAARLAEVKRLIAEKATDKTEQAPEDLSEFDDLSKLREADDGEGDGVELDRPRRADEPGGPTAFDETIPVGDYLAVLTEYQRRMKSLGVALGQDSLESGLGVTEIHPDGRINIGIDPGARMSIGRLAKGDGKTAMKLLADMMDEEMIHAARMIGLRDDWTAAGRRGAFTDFVEANDAAVWQEIGASYAAATGEDKAALGDALKAVWNLYVAEPSGGQEPFIERVPQVADMVAAVATRPEATVAMVNEYIRMVYQQARTGRIYEGTAAKLLTRVVSWVKRQVAAIRKVVARAFTGQVSGTMARELNRLDSILANPETAFAQPVKLAAAKASFRPGALPPPDLPEGSKMRRFAERTAADPAFADAAGALSQDPAAYYRPQSYQEIMTRLQASTDAELRDRVASMQEIESEWNDGMLAGIELANRIQAQGGDIAPLVAQMAAKGTTAAQLLRQMAEWKTVVPDLALKAIEGELRKKGRFLDDARRQRIIDLFTADRDARGALREAEAELSKGWTDAAAAKVDAAEATARRAHWEFTKHVSGLIPMSWSDLLVTALQGNLLTPMSQSANVAGNALFLPLQFGQRTVAAALDQVHSLFRKGVGRTTAAPARLVGAYLGGMADAVPDALRALLRGQDPKGAQAGDWNRNFAPLRAIVQAWTGEGMPLTDKGKVSAHDRFKKLAEFSLGVFAAPMLRLLGAGDALFSGAARNALLREQAILQGKKGADAKLFMKIPDQQTVDLLEEEVRETVFQQANGFVDWVMAGERRLAAGRFLGPVLRVASRIVFPYIKTPTNLAVEGLMYGIPALSLAAAMKAAVNGDRRAAYQNMGKFVMGSAMLMAAFYLAKNGLLAGDGDDEEKKRQLQYGSLAPNTVNISALGRVQDGGSGEWQPGDRVISYTKLGFFGVVLAMVANGKARADEEDIEFEAAAVLSGQATIPRVGSAILNMTMLKGAAGFLGALAKDDYSNFAENFANTMPSVVIPNTFAAVNRQRWTYLPEVGGLDAMGKFEHAVKTKLFMTSDLPIKRDLFGRGVKATPDGAAPWAYTHFDVTKARNIADDPIMKAVYDVYHATKDGAAIPSVPGRTLQVNGKGVELTDTGYDRFLEVVGEERQAAFWRMIDAKPNYAGIGFPQRLSLLRNAWEAGYNRGRARFLKEYLAGVRGAGPAISGGAGALAGVAPGVGSR